MRVSCFSFLTHSVSEHPMSDHVPTVPAPAVLPDGGGSVRVTRAKALRSSMSSSVPGGAALVAPQHVQPDDPPQGDDSGVSSTFNITKPKVPDTVTGVPDANALLSGSGPPGGFDTELRRLCQTTPCVFGEVGKNPSQPPCLIASLSDKTHLYRAAHGNYEYEYPTGRAHTVTT